MARYIKHLIAFVTCKSPELLVITFSVHTTQLRSVVTRTNGLQFTVANFNMPTIAPTEELYESGAYLMFALLSTFIQSAMHILYVRQSNVVIQTKNAPIYFMSFAMKNTAVTNF